jgi:tetratricopeptide (TPR) repeat protein
LTSLGVALLLACAVPSLPAAALADEQSEPDAEALKRAREQFSQALALQTGGNWAGALALLKEVAAIKSTPQVRFNMALCEENLGRLVAALGDYELAAADARAENAEKVAEEVDGRLEALRQRIPRIVVQRGEGAEAASVSLDGVPIGDAVIGTPMPADPGPHVIEASAPGFAAFKRSLRIAERQTETVIIELEPLPKEEPAVTGPKVKPATSSGAGRTVGFVLGGVGLASFAASGAFFYLRSTAIEDLDNACGSDRQSCPESSVDQGKLYTTLGNVGLAVGAVGVGVGLVLILTGGSSTEEASVSVSPSAVGSLAGATVSGRF